MGGRSGTFGFESPRRADVSVWRFGLPVISQRRELYMTREDVHAIDDCPADALCAVLRGAGENPDLLVSTIVGKEDSG